MNWYRFVIAGAVVAGAASGPLSLESAAASQPPITWGNLAFIAMGALIALPVVLGFQAVAGKTNMLHRGWLFFFYAAISCTTSGLAAVILAIRGAGLAPHAFLFLVLGMAMFAGLGIVNTLFRRKT